MIKTILRMAMLTALLWPGVALAANNPQARPEAVVTVGNARFTVLTPEMLRIEYSQEAKFEDKATFAIVNRNLDVPWFSTDRDDRYFYLDTEKLHLKYLMGSDPRANSYNLTVSMEVNGMPVEWYPGKPDPMNLKGTTRTLDSANGQNKRAELEDGLVSRSGWAIIDDSFERRRADGSRSYALEPNETVGYDWLAERADPQAMDIYFMGYGHDYKKALKDFTRVAGNIPLPPAYVFGYWYSKYQSYTADEFRGLVKDLKANGIPTDVLILDMDWHWNGNKSSLSEGIGGWTGWSWNTNLIPDGKGLLADIHKSGLRTALNLHPADGIEKNESPEYFRDMNRMLGGKYVKAENGSERIEWVLDSADFTKAFFDTIIRTKEKEGVDFWWLDWQQWLTSKHTPDLGQTFWCNHVFFNEMDKNRTDRRPMIYHRWGGLGSHRYQIGFSGDTHINYPTLAFEPYFTATSSNVGYGYWGHDLGGHQAKEEEMINDPELLLRWVQFGVFTPIFRTHATADPRIERRIWKFENFNDILDAVKLRYRMFPYLYGMARKSFDTGVSIVRPMYYDYPEADEAYAYENQYMFGDDILVAPVVEPSVNGKNTQRIWFPEGQWWDVSHSRMIDGGAVCKIDFGLTEIPYFIRSGALIPMNAPDVMSTAIQPERLVLSVVAGTDGEAVYYEDQLDNRDYADVYATTALVQKGNTVTIAPRRGDSTGLLAKRAYTVDIYNVDGGKAVTVNGKKTKSQYNAATRCLSVDVPKTACDKAIEIKYFY